MNNRPQNILHSSYTFRFQICIPWVKRHDRGEHEKNVTPADLLGELTSEYYQSDTWESGEPEQSYDASAPTLDAKTVSAVMAALASDTSGEYSDISESAFQAWLTHHPEVYASCRARYISAQLQSLTDTQRWLEGLKNSFDYYLTNTVTGDCFTSLPDGTTQESAESQLLHTTQYAMALKSTTTGATFYSKHTDLAQELESLNASDYMLDSSRNGTAICAMTTDAYDNLCLSWSEIHRLFANLIIIYAISAVVIALCLLVLCFGAGRRPDDDTCYLLGFDRIWTEVQIFFGMCACIAFAGVISLFLNFFGDITVSLSFTAICTGVCAGIRCICRRLPCDLSVAGAPSESASMAQRLDYLAAVPQIRHRIAVLAEQAVPQKSAAPPLYHRKHLAPAAVRRMDSHSCCDYRAAHRLYASGRQHRGCQPRCARHSRRQDGYANHGQRARPQRACRTGSRFERHL